MSWTNRVEARFDIFLYKGGKTMRPCVVNLFLDTYTCKKVLEVKRRVCFLQERSSKTERGPSEQ